MRNSRIIILFLSLFILLPFTFTAAQSVKCGDSDFDCQIAKATRDINAKPDDPEPYFMRGRAFRLQNKTAQAVADLTKYIGFNPKKEYLADGYYQRAMCYQSRKLAKQALADYSKAIELVPEDTAYLRKRGELYNELKYFDQALADLNKVVALEPKKAVGFADRGIAYFGKKDYEHALEDFDMAIKLDPNAAEAYYSRANVYRARKEFEKAIAGYDKYIELTTSNLVFLSDGYQNRALTYADMGNYDQALKDLKSAMELDPADPAPYRARAIVYRKQGKIPLAEADEKRAIALKR